MTSGELARALEAVETAFVAVAKALTNFVFVSVSDSDPDSESAIVLFA
jgi:hypothetical protein